MANRRNVFKVETIGDCYVAVVGLPDPCSNHAEVMVQFAHDILQIMGQVTLELGKTLGPGTASLKLRVAVNTTLHSFESLKSIITESFFQIYNKLKAKQWTHYSRCFTWSKGTFQLFGDTVNTAARMESNSLPGKILCTQKTADLLVSSGKEHWISPREGLVDAKGKGLMQCYWVSPKSDVVPGSVNSYSSNDYVMDDTDREAHSVAWTAELLETILYEVVAQRSNGSTKSIFSFERLTDSLKHPRDEVSETITIPQTKSGQSLMRDSFKALISDVVKLQIQDYVGMISKMYRQNPFHNFHHATHVIMATHKLLNRVVKPTEGCVSSTVYGITLDPLSQFAIVFSALIHDVDHPGVSNAQLVKEGSSLAIRFHNKSVAEQNSVVLAWNLLMDPKFTDFRNLIMMTESEIRRFRQIVVNSVLATALFDSDLKNLRDTRWNKVFDLDFVSCTKKINREEDNNRRATIIIEHIMQASDVSHTMQHWHIYQEWNRRLFNEMYDAYKSYPICVELLAEASKRLHV